MAPLSLLLAGVIGASAGGGIPAGRGIPAAATAQLAEVLPAAGAALPAGTAQPRRSASPAKPSGPISYSEKRIKFDYPAHDMLLLGDVVVTQGDLRVTADRAEAKGVDPKETQWSPLKNSRWTFTGNVHISSKLQGNLESDTATVDWGDNQMLNAVVKGSPAQFEQTSSTTGVLARGHADTITYTVAANTIRLTDDAWIEYGNQASGVYVTSAPVLVYNIERQQLEGAGAADHGQRVHITVLPRPSAPGQNAPARNAAKQGAAAPSASKQSAGGPSAPQKGDAPGTRP